MIKVWHAAKSALIDLRDGADARKDKGSTYALVCCLCWSTWQDNGGIPSSLKSNRVACSSQKEHALSRSLLLVSESLNKGKAFRYSRFA